MSGGSALSVRCGRTPARRSPQPVAKVRGMTEDGKLHRADRPEMTNTADAE